MGYSAGAVQLREPDLTDLPRVQDRVGFLFLDRVQVEQGRTGLEAWSKDADGVTTRLVIPAAQLAVLCLGPGTSVTGPAMSTLFRSGTAVVFTDARGLAATAVARPLASTGRWAAAQARVVCDPEARLRAARVLYEARFQGQALPPDAPLASLRGLEGHRVKAVYRAEAARWGVRGFRRDVEGEDTVNGNLNRANSILYGVALAVTGAFGLSPALGVIHEGTSRAFLYDLADVFKPSVSIPAAFEAAARPGVPLGEAVRDRLHDQRVLERMVGLVPELFGGVAGAGAVEENRLFDGDGFVAGLKNWALA